MRCIKKCYATEQIATNAMHNINRQATERGWNLIKGVYFCSNHQAWHLTSMKVSDQRLSAKWRAGLKKSGTQKLQKRQRVFDGYMELCKQQLQQPNGTYKKPSEENHHDFMISLVGHRRWPVKFKYVEMWWNKLPPEKQFKN